MKKFHVAALACLFVVTGAIAGCSDDEGLPGIATGTAPATFSGESLASDTESICQEGPCDGDLGDVEVTEVAVNGSGNDVFALFDLVLRGFDVFEIIEAIFNTDVYNDVIDTLGEDPVKLTFNITRVTNCNSTGIEEIDDPGTAEGGTISETAIVTAMFDSGGDVSDSDVEAVGIVGFNNCLIAGDLLDEIVPAPMGAKGVDDGSAIRLNGGWVFRVDEPDMPSVANPESVGLTGRVLLSGDRNNDGTFDDPFWTHVVNLDAHGFYDGSDFWYNGGVCMGEAIAFGTEAEDDVDDGCAPDTDMQSGAWVSAGWIFD